MRPWAAGIVGAALLLSACDSLPDLGLGTLFGGEDNIEEPVSLDGPAEPLPPSPAVGGERAWSGPRAAAAMDMFVTARDERGWRILWQLVGGEPPGPLPDGAMAVAVFLGPRPTGGYAVEITDVSARADAVVVRYDETRPPPDILTSQALTSPYAIRLVARTEAPVRYRHTDD